MINILTAINIDFNIIILEDKDFRLRYTFSVTILPKFYLMSIEIVAVLVLIRG